MLTPLTGTLTPLGKANVAFTPASLAGLVLDLDATLGLYQDAAGTTPATADGNPVGKWTDQSGQGNHLTQSTAGQRPLLKTGIVNGLPVIRSDGVNDYLRAASFRMGGSGSCSVFMAVRANSLDTSGTYLLMDGDVVNAFTLSLTSNAPSFFKLTRGQIVNSANVLPTLAVSTFGALACTLSGQTFAGAISGTLQKNAEVTHAASLGYAESGSPLQLFSQTAGVIGSVDVARVLVYQPDLSASDALRVLGYLQSVYGIL